VRPRGSADTSGANSQYEQMRLQSFVTLPSVELA
jgi:hypothetical protein